jgi:[ribosomal protein S18]-alanine N-acetyltransferase
MARLHGLCFVAPRPWTATEFGALLAQPTTRHVILPHGIAFGRIAADEAEVLTLAVDPARRGQGLGAQLLADLTALFLRDGARRVFLEVGVDNLAARALYTSAGFREVGCRPGYFTASGQPAVDAIVLARDLHIR